MYGGVSAYGELPIGPYEHMVSLHFTADNGDEPIRTLCIDSVFIPPSGDFVFVDLEGDIIPIEISGPFCWPIVRQCGDANGDKELNVGDVVFLINYVFRDGPAPDPIEYGDANADGDANIGDAVYIINFIFRNGPSPACP
jgi:hypothetical protein